MFANIPFSAWLGLASLTKILYRIWKAGRKQYSIVFAPGRLEQDIRHPCSPHSTVICWLTLRSWGSIQPTALSTPAKCSPLVFLNPGPRAYLAPWLRASASARHGPYSHQSWRLRGGEWLTLILTRPCKFKFIFTASSSDSSSIPVPAPGSSSRHIHCLLSCQTCVRSKLYNKFLHMWIYLYIYSIVIWNIYIITLV